MLMPKEKEELKKELEKIDTAQDLFDFLSARYDLESVKMGIITKPFMVKGAIDIINFLNPKKRNGR